MLVLDRLNREPCQGWRMASIAMAKRVISQLAHGVMSAAMELLAQAQPLTECRRRSRWCFLAPRHLDADGVIVSV